MTNRLTADDLSARLRTAFPGAQVEVEDEGHLHVGHEGARSGGHFRAHIVSDAFAGLSTVARHRLVYHSLREWLPGPIHALAIDARTPTGNTSPTLPNPILHKEQK